MVLIDREQGGPQHLKANGLNLHAAFTLSDLLKVIKREKWRGFEAREGQDRRDGRESGREKGRVMCGP